MGPNVDLTSNIIMFKKLNIWDLTKPARRSDVQAASLYRRYDGMCLLGPNLPVAGWVSRTDPYSVHNRLFCTKTVL